MANVFVYDAQVCICLRIMLFVTQSVDTYMHLVNVVDTVKYQLPGMVYLDVEENATAIEYLFN